MNRYLITLGRSHYDDGENYPPLDVALEHTAITDVFTRYFGYTHLKALSTQDLELSHLEKTCDWFLEEDGDGLPARDVDDLVVIYYTGHGDLTREELRLVMQKCTPRNLFAKGLEAKSLLDGWLDSPVRHVWLILDVCHSGRVGSDLGSIPRHLEYEVQEQDESGRSWHVVTSCRGRQRAGVSVFADALEKIVSELLPAEFVRQEHLPVSTLMQFMQQYLALFGQASQHFHGGDVGGQFLPYESWRAAKSGANASPIDAQAQEGNLASLMQLLNQLAWPVPMFVRLLPSARQMLARRQPFSSTADLVKWVCGMEPDTSRLCPLVVLALRAAAEQDAELDQEPLWITEMAAWRRADLKKCRDLAGQELKTFQEHAASYRSRIKMIGEAILSPSGDYSSSVNFRVLHDFEDDNGALLFPLARWDGLKPTDLTQDEYATRLASFVCQECISECEEDPIVQITLPLHLIHEPVESILIPDGLNKTPLGTLYPVVLTVWERDSGETFSQSRRKRKRKRAALSGDTGQPPLCCHLDAQTDLHGDDVLIITACGPDSIRFYEAVNAGLPIILWTRQSASLPFSGEPLTGWLKRLAKERRNRPDLDAALIWDDHYSGERKPPSALKTPSAAAVVAA